MKICVLVEGSYPYVVGGVSAWLQMLIQGMPEHEFVIFSIGAEEKDRGKFKYTLPQNVTEVREIFLDSILNLHCPSSGHYALSESEKENLENLLSGEGDIALEKLLSIFRAAKHQHDFLQIFMSYDFFEVIKSVYKKKYSYLPFTDYFWTIRSMLLPLFFLLQQDLPEADVYHSVAAGYCGAVGALAATVYKKPFLLTEHGIYSREREEEIIKCDWAKGEFKSVWIRYFYNLARLAYHKANKVITLFEKNSDIEISLGCAARKIQIIPNGIHEEQFVHLPDCVEKKATTITIGAIVRVVPIKDIITMLRSFYFVKQKVPNARFLIMGSYEEDPEYYEECLNVVETLRLEDVIFTGAVQVKEYLGAIDILVLSSISEGQPLAVLEGMASGKPFVATDVGCCRELLYGSSQDSLGKAGYVVPVMDFEQMARYLIMLAQDDTLREQMGNIGRKRVYAYYTFMQFINAYRKLYQEQSKRAAVGGSR